MSDTYGPNGTARGRRVWRTLSAWAAALALLTFLGISLEGRLAPMSLAVPGSPSSRAEATLKAEFGPSIPLEILLRGPPAEIDREGPRLVAALKALGHVQVLSPWAGAASPRALRPKPGAAFVLVNFERPESEAMATVPAAEAAVARTVRRPVRSYFAGILVIGRALQQATLAETLQAELIALPALIIVLLLVFRSPVAAAVPLAMGGATVAAGRGLLWLATFVTPINSLAVSVAAMMSLALGVDYALLMVSRVRQEAAAGWDHDAAVSIARRTAGRTIVAAGGTLVLTMIAANAVATPGMLAPVATGVICSGLLSVALALSAMPALLRLIGPNLNRWEVRLRHAGAASRLTAAGSLAERLLAHPMIVIPPILVAAVALAAPAAALRMGPPDVAQLPASNPARIAVTMVQRTIGPGWTAPFVIVLHSKQGAITTHGRLRALIRAQEELGREPDVAAALGPGSIAGAQHELDELHAAAASAPGRLEGAQAGIERLRSGLGRASAGVAELRSGLTSAAAGAGALGGAGGKAASGAELLAAETGRARKGAALLANETGRADAGAKRLAAETGRARKGAKRLASETGRAETGAKLLASEAGRADSGAGALENGLATASTGSATLASGLDEADAGAERLAGSDAQLTAGAAKLAEGITTLDTTVHTALGPVTALTEQLHIWVGNLEALKASVEELRARLREAMRELGAMTVGRADPRYAALAKDLTAAVELAEQNALAKLAPIQRQICAGLERLGELPAAIAKLTGGLDQLTAGADRLAAGTRESEEGAQSLGSALHRLAVGGHRLSNGLESLSGGAGELAGGLGKLAAGDGKLAGGLGKLAAGDGKLAGGLGKLEAGNGRLAGGLTKLAAGNGRLAGGLGKLQAGNGRLAGGLGELAGGADRLAGGLKAGEGRVGALAAGLGGAGKPLKGYAAMLANYRREYALMHSESPNALESGYLVLTALDGTPTPIREQVAQLVNVNGGGGAARIMVVAASAPASAATAALSTRLRRDLPALGASIGGTAQIGQGAEYLLDYQAANTERFPWLVVSLAVIAVLTLIVILRALLLPVIAVALNLVTIAVAYGALELLTALHLLGGPGYIDATSGAGILAIMFVLSIDYEVFLLMRMREHWVSEGDADGAIRHGLRKTAGVITGSAAIMTAVFLAFAGAEVVPVRQFGVGLTIAVLLDATIVRLVLLPAIMHIVGARIWWMPEWLARRIPAME
jgi:RND superfamily putative drug exporter